MKVPKTVIAVVAIGLLLALTWAAPYGTQNQATYLLDPMQRAFPELFARDWFVSETPPYLPVFGWLAKWLYVIDPAGPTAVIAGHVVIAVATYAAIYWLVSSVRAGIVGFVIVAATISVTHGMTMGAHYLIADYLQPSSLAMLGWILALAAFVRDRYWLAGICAALGGAVHANFLVLGIGAFAIAALVRRDVGWRGIAALLAPQLVVLALFLPSLLDAAGPSSGAVWILTHFHAPGHYAAERLIRRIHDVVAWQLAAAAAVRILGEDRAVRALWWFSLVIGVIVVGSALAFLLPPFEALTQMRPARLAPLGQLAAFTLVVGAISRCGREPVELRARVQLVAGVAAVITTLVIGTPIRWMAGVAGAAAFALVLLTTAPPRRSAFVGVFAALVVVYSVWRGPRGANLTTRPLGWRDELALTTWAAANTPVDALFVAPPDLTRFRVLARRAVVADTKSPPLRPDLLVRWYLRLNAMALLPGAAHTRDVEARYRQLTQGELHIVARMFDADYIIVTKHNPAWADTPVFDSLAFKVYAVQR